MTSICQDSRLKTQDSFISHLARRTCLLGIPGIGSHALLGIPGIGSRSFIKLSLVCSIHIATINFHVTSLNWDRVYKFKFLIKRPFIQVPTCPVCGQWFFIALQLEHDLPGNEKPLTKAWSIVVVHRLST